MRIIGGAWRGRKLDIAPLDDLRPTPDRVRETLFNWLSPYMEGAYCLDLFAGTGVLGFEALSRGAAGCVFVEQRRELVAALKQGAERLGADTAEIVGSDARTWWEKPVKRRFDIVFLDPPYDSTLAAEACAALPNRGHLAPGALVYLEGEREAKSPHPGLELLKQGRAGHVHYGLLRYTEGDP